ncbi:MAG: hypothetical protein PHN75_03595 [Syntrophales bacterium]|nr:hypothetical protein [Syntrophales bacterium]
MHHSLIKRIVLLTLSGLLLAAFAVAFHHQGSTLLRTSCSLCKIRTSISETVSKNGIDSPPAVMVAYLGLAAIIHLSAAVDRESTTIFISSPIAYGYPNKASPIRS